MENIYFFFLLFLKISNAIYFNGHYIVFLYKVINVYITITESYIFKSATPESAWGYPQPCVWGLLLAVSGNQSCYMQIILLSILNYLSSSTVNHKNTYHLYNLFEND